MLNSAVSDTLIRACFDYSKTTPPPPTFLMKQSLTPSLLRDYFDYASFDYSSLLIRDFYGTFTVFSFKFLMTYSSLPIRDLSLIGREE